LAFRNKVGRLTRSAFSLSIDGTQGRRRTVKGTVGQETPMKKDRRRHKRRTGTDRRSTERRATGHRGRFLMGLGGPFLSEERRQLLRRHDHRRRVTNRRAG